MRQSHAGGDKLFVDYCSRERRFTLANLLKSAILATKPTGNLAANLNPSRGGDTTMVGQTIRERERQWRSRE
jgi:hypothetical protein